MVKSDYRRKVERFFHSRLGYNVMNDPDQYNYIEALIKPAKELQAVFVDAPAGTGKTSIALAAAYYLMEMKQISKIMYVRNTVALRENGFLPGTQEEKEMVYMRPLKENIDRIAARDKEKDLFERWINEGKLEAVSTSYIRGTDIDDDVFILVDEAQNLSIPELQGVLTRKHDSVKIAVVGSHLQVDTPNIQRFGLKGLLPFEVYMDHFCNQQTKIPVQRCELTINYRGEFAQHADSIQQTINKYNQQITTKREIEQEHRNTPESVMDLWEGIMHLTEGEQKQLKGLVGSFD